MSALDSIITVAAADSPMSPALPGARCSRCQRELHDDEIVTVCEWRDQMFGYCADCAAKLEVRLADPPRTA